jgi:hypothetical protein
MITIRLTSVLYLYPRLDVDNNPYTRLITEDGEYDVIGHINFNYQFNEVTFKEKK